MTIEEAITVLGEHSADEISPSDRELLKALKLGIEALKRIQWARKEPRAAVVSSLAGDTRSRRSCCFSNKQTPELFRVTKDHFVQLENQSLMASPVLSLPLM